MCYGILAATMAVCSDQMFGQPDHLLWIWVKLISQNPQNGLFFLIVSSMFLKVIQQFTTTFLGIFMGFSILFGSSNGGGLSENFSARSSNRCVDHPTQRIGRQARPE